MPLQTSFSASVLSLCCQAEGNTVWHTRHALEGDAAKMVLQKVELEIDLEERGWTWNILHLLQSAMVNIAFFLYSLFCTPGQKQPWLQHQVCHQEASALLPTLPIICFMALWPRSFLYSAAYSLSCIAALLWPTSLCTACVHSITVLKKGCLSEVLEEW